MIDMITCANSITAIGHNGQTTAASYFSGITRIEYNTAFGDAFGNPIKSAKIEGIVDGNPDDRSLMKQLTHMCLSDLCTTFFENKKEVDHVFLFLGMPSKDRPGPAFFPSPDAMTQLEEVIKPFAETILSETFETGNASAINGMLRSRDILMENPKAVCIVGAVDSLLAPETLVWFEKDQRLKSDSDDREQSFVTSQAVSFFIMESKHGARSRKSTILAHVKGLGNVMEPAPFVSDAPTKSIGLTQAIRAALNQQRTDPAIIDSVFCDLNGEYHRAREWGFTDLRCFENGNPEKQVFHPADCMGSVGAASLPLFVNLAVEGFKKDTIGKTVCLFASDDHGERGALIIEKPGKV